ncbi:MAG: 4Fe-4S binding protein [Eggerthellaceae bacterium]|jgi:polyferredoxin|nr:4Fe-4S binding protein [Eggerthellaceae bacterium]MCH4221743.1 4Fe-4S binding protein [Eggerthellaceae bacterium]
MKQSKRQRIRVGILLTSFLLFPVTIFYFSPYLIVLGAFEGVAAGSMIMFGLQLIAALVLRRAYCGWACPAGGLQEAEMRCVNKRAKLGKRVMIKWVIWVPWIMSIIAGAIVAGGIRSVDLTFQTVSGLSVASVHGLIIYIAIVMLFFIPNLILGRRAMCHCICWMAPFMIIGEHIGQWIHVPQLHVVSDPNRCIKCGLCEKACPMSLPVEQMVPTGAITHSECIQCGACCDACKKDALKLVVSRIK